MKAAAKKIYGDASLKDLTIAVQGTGKVGRELIPYLIEEGARVIAANTSKESLDILTSNIHLSGWWTLKRFMNKIAISFHPVP